VGWQVDGADAAGRDRLAHARYFVRPEVVHDDDVAVDEGRRQDRLDVSAEDDAIDVAVDDEGGGDAVVAERGDEGRGFPVAVRHGGAQPLTARAAAAGACHVGCGPGLVDEQQPCRVQAWLPLAPGVPCGGNVGALLLRSVAGLFLSVRPSRSSARSTCRRGWPRHRAPPAATRAVRPRSPPGGAAASARIAS